MSVMRSARGDAINLRPDMCLSARLIFSVCGDEHGSMSDSGWTARRLEVMFLDFE